VPIQKYKSRVVSVRQPIIVIGPSIAYIPLTQGQYAAIDLCDAPLIAGKNWCAKWRRKRKAFVAATSRRENKSRELMLHQLICPAPAGLEIDHINRNPLDNRRANLRVCTRSQNEANKPPRKGGTSRYKGVSKSRSGWFVSIRRNGKSVYVGLFQNEAEAGAAYDRAALDVFGEFAYLNFPTGTSCNTSNCP
jgi:hypothetical protein